MFFSGAVLFVRDFAGMRDFYSRMLQLQPANQESTESFAVFDLNGNRLALHAIPEQCGPESPIASTPPAREQNPVKLIFTVPDVPSERSRLEASGATMLQRPWQDLTESCDGFDPEGNVFQIARSSR